MTSGFFVKGHPSARWVLGGFVVSHVIVFGIAPLKLFTMRRGFVSLCRVLRWASGLVLVIAGACSADRR